MTKADLPAATELSIELGYPTSLADVSARFALLETHPDGALFVAERDGIVIGFLQAGIQVPLEAPIYAEIVALSITGKAHRTGAGRALVDRAIAFAKEKGIAQVRVRSNVARDVSHVFYTQLGFVKKKTQHVYELPVS